MKISKLRGMPSGGIYPKVFPGPSTEDGACGNRAGNPGSGGGMLEGCDWGTGRLFAHAHFSFVVLSDVESGQVVATLDGHAANVTCVRFLGHSKTGELLVASGDSQGWIMVWDVGEGEALRSISIAAPGSEYGSLSGVTTGLHQVMAVRAIEPASSANALSSSAHSQIPFRLLCLSPTALTLLDIASQSTLWRCELATPSQPLCGLSVNSRDDCVVYSKEPMLKVVLKTGSPGASFTVTTCELGSLVKPVYEVQTSHKGENTSGIFLGGADRAKGGDVLEHAAFCAANRSHVYLVFTSEVVLYDLDVKHRIAVICSASAKRSEFRAILPSPGAGGHMMGVELNLSGAAPFLTLHHDGSVCAWLKNDVKQGYLSVPVDLRSSRQGYTGRPYLIGIDRSVSLEAVLAASAEDCNATVYVPNTRICVVSNDGSVSVWQHTVELGWSLTSSLPATPARIAAIATLQLNVGKNGAPTLCFVILTTTGLFLLYDVLTGEMLLKTEVMSEKGCVACSDIHAITPTSILIGGVRAVPKPGAPPPGKSKKAASGITGPGGLLDNFTGLVREGSFDSHTIAKDGSQLDLTALGAATNPNEEHHNYIAIVTVPNLSVQTVRGGAPETQKLLQLAVSPSKLFFTALHTGGVYEVWEIATLSIIRRLTHPDSPAYSVLTWMPRSVVAAWDRKGAEERKEAVPSGDPADVFIWLASDGSMTFFKVKNNEVSYYYVHAKERIYVGFGFPVVAADWYDGLLLLGDSAGHLCLVNLRNEKFSYITQQPSCPIRQLKICPRGYIDADATSLRDDRSKKGVTCLALVLFADGEYGVWNVAQKQRLAFSKRDDAGPQARHIKAAAVSWAPGPFPVIATLSGAVLILDLSLTSANSPVSLRALSAPMRTAVLLPRVQRAFLLANLCNGVTHLPQREGEKEDKEEFKPFRNAYGEQVVSAITSHGEESKLHLQLISAESLATLNGLSENDMCGHSILQRCFVAAAVFADENRMQFYKTAQTALRLCKDDARQRPAFTPTPSDPVKLSSEEEESQQIWSHASAACATDAAEYDAQHYVCASAVEEMVGSAGLLHTSHCCTTQRREQAVRGAHSPDQFERIAEQHVRLGAMNPACRLLLDTPSTSPEWKANLYKACLVAAGVGPRHYHNTVKRVASMYVAHGEIESAVEMLCLVGKGREACLVYQAHDMWEEAGRLARTCLATAEANEMVLKWGAHLAGQDGEAKIQAAVLYLAAADVEKALRLLEPELEFVELAAHLAAACVAEEVLPSDHPQVKQVFSQYTDFLMSISASDAAEAFSNLIERVSEGKAAMSAVHRTPPLAVAPDVRREASDILDDVFGPGVVQSPVKKEVREDPVPEVVVPTPKVDIVDAPPPSL